jgi:hypothetical protein
VKHAGTGALDILEPLLDKIRKHAALREKRRGLFLPEWEVAPRQYPLLRMCSEERGKRIPQPDPTVPPLS